MDNELKVGDRVSTPLLTVGTVLEIVEGRKPDFYKAWVAIDGQEEHDWYWVDSLRLHDPEAELERVLIRAEYSESSDALMLASEIRSLRARLEAVCDVVSNAVAFGDHPEPGRIMEAVRGE